MADRGGWSLAWPAVLLLLVLLILPLGVAWGRTVGGAAVSGHPGITGFRQYAETDRDRYDDGESVIVTYRACRSRPWPTTTNSPGAGPLSVVIAALGPLWNIGARAWRCDFGRLPTVSQQVSAWGDGDASPLPSSLSLTRCAAVGLTCVSSHRMVAASCFTGRGEVSATSPRASGHANWPSLEGCSAKTFTEDHPEALAGYKGRYRRWLYGIS